MLFPDKIAPRPCAAQREIVYTSSSKGGEITAGTNEGPLKEQGLSAARPPVGGGAGEPGHVPQLPGAMIVSGQPYNFIDKEVTHLQGVQCICRLQSPPGRCGSPGLLLYCPVRCWARSNTGHHRTCLHSRHYGFAHGITCRAVDQMTGLEAVQGSAREQDSLLHAGLQPQPGREEGNRNFDAARQSIQAALLCSGQQHLRLPTAAA